MAPELQGGFIGVEGSSNPTPAEKQECLETVSRNVMGGWEIAAEPTTPIGWLAALTAETACVPFVNLTRLNLDKPASQTAGLNHPAPAGRTTE